jgi:hypothetical protein
MHRLKLAVVTLTAVFLTAVPAVAQVQTGSILVKAVDEQGAVLPGVTVTISSAVLVAGQMTSVTDAGGAVRFPALPPGTYSVKLELQGFQTLVRENVIVSVGQTTPLELTLKVAAVEETITVTGESPVVDTTSGNVSVTLSQDLLQRTPGGRDIWSLVEYKVPGLISSRPDVGGSAGGLQGAMVARGTPNSQNVQFLNGINVGDPAAIGYTGFYYDYDAFEEIQVSTGAHDLSVPSAGVFLNMVTKSGTDRYQGKASFFWQGDATQATNVDENLLRFGFRKDAGAVNYVSDATAQLGGPIVKNKLRFFGSYRDWRVHVNVPGFPEEEYTDMKSGLSNVAWQMTQNNRFTGFYARQYYYKPNRGASANNNPTSNWKEDDVFDITQGLWNSVLSNRSYLDARFTFNRIFFPLYLKGNDQALFDQATGYQDRNNTIGYVFERRRFQTNANYQYYLDNWLGGRHEFRVGFDHAHMPTKTQVYRYDDLNLSWNSALGRGTEVTLFNSPVNSKATVDQTALFAQDNFTIKRLTLMGGVRWERVEAYLPEQSSPPSRWFPNLQRTFPEVRDIINWKTLGPRFSAVYDVRGDGRTAAKVNWGRYYYTVSSGVTNPVNPNFSVSERYVWNDVNGDLHFQPNELGQLLSRAGGLTTSYDPDLKRPYTDEFATGVDRELIPNLRLSAIFTYRKEKKQYGNVDFGVPFSAYSPVTVTDIGRDGLAGTADDTTITVYNQDRATLGRNRIVITNDDRLSQTYRGLEITANKRFSNRWQMLVGYTVSKTEVEAANGVADPNALINAKGVIGIDRTHTLKITGSYLLPGDWNLAANFRTQTGEPVTRTLRVSGLNQGVVTVNAEPLGSYRLDPLTTVDLRLSKIFRLQGRQELEANFDVYNLTNANTVWAVRTLTGRINLRYAGDPAGQVINQQQFLSPTNILAPRIARFGVTYRF